MSERDEYLILCAARLCALLERSATIAERLLALTDASSANEEHYPTSLSTCEPVSSDASST